MKKKYLKTVEDVLALKDTDTKIYAENIIGYYQFVNGIWCAFDDDGSWTICPTTCDEEDLYILEEESEEPMQEATEEDVGKLCLFWDNEERDGERSILKVIHSKELYPYLTEDCNSYVHCRRLSPAEVAEITGYRVEEK